MGWWKRLMAVTEYSTSRRSDQETDKVEAAKVERVSPQCESQSRVVSRRQSNRQTQARGPNGSDTERWMSGWIL